MATKMTDPTDLAKEIAAAVEKYLGPVSIRAVDTEGLAEIISTNGLAELEADLTKRDELVAFYRDTEVPLQIRKREDLEARLEEIEQQRQEAVALAREINTDSREATTEWVVLVREMKARLEAAEEGLTAATENGVLWHRQCVTAERERDEARGVLEKMAKVDYFSQPNGEPFIQAARRFLSEKTARPATDEGEGDG